MNKTETFIEKAKKVHKGENLDYSKVVYVNNRTNVCIIDHDIDADGNEYGEFWQTPSNHLKGQGHPKKRSRKIANSKSANQNDIIRRFKEKHKGENLDYSKVVYVNMHTPVCIIDHSLNPQGIEYGEFWQEPVVHLKGCGHPRKAIDANSNKQRLTTDEFIQKCRLVNDDRNYDYSLVVYRGNNHKVSVVCNRIGCNGKIHGLFEMTPSNLLQGKGCPKCGNHYSYVEDEIIDFLKQINLESEKGNKTILQGKEIDIFIPSKNVGIEYNGVKWHSEWFGHKDRHYHVGKTDECNSKGVSLIQIFEDEYILKKDIVLHKLKHILGCDDDLPRIYARKCEYRKISKGRAFEFLEKYHIQGFARGTKHYGAFYNEELVAVMSFRLCDKEWELVRFASSYKYKYCGVAGKLFSIFVKENNPSIVKSFADRRWTINVDNNLYVKLGFINEGYTKPDYMYYNPQVDRYRRFHKFGFRKQHLIKKYGFNENMTETEMMKELGYDRVWNCGLIKYVWKR